MFAFKKSKAIFDEKQKEKHRLAALCLLLDGSSDQEQLKFFLENHEVVYTVLYESFWYLVEKIKAKEKAEKGISHIGSKEATELFKVLSIFRKVSILLPAKIRDGWQAKGALDIIRNLLHPLNHHRLKFEGLQILQDWINCYDSEIEFQSPELFTLYSTAIQLDQFEPFSLPDGYLSANCVRLEGNCIHGIACSKKETSPLSAGDVQEKSAMSEQPPPSPVHHFSSRQAIGLQNGMGCIALNTSTSLLDDSTELFEEILQNLYNLCVAACQPTPSKDSKTSAVECTGKSAEECTRPSMCSSPSKSSDSGLDSAGLIVQHVPVISATDPDVENNSNSNDESPCQIDIVGSAENTDAFKVASAQWMNLRRCYLQNLFPAVSESLNMVPKVLDGHQPCPLPILVSLLSFIAIRVLDPNYSGLIQNSSEEPLSNEILSKAASVMRRIVFSTQEDREIIQEIVRQGLLAPFSSEAARYSLFLIRTWLFNPFADRPLAKPDNGDGGKLGVSEVIMEDNNCFRAQNSDRMEYDKEARIYAHRYISYIRLLFFPRKDSADSTTSQVLLLKEGFQLFRLMAMEIHVKMSEQTWKVLTQNLLEICEELLCKPLVTPGAPQHPCAEDISYIAVESTLITWIRFGTKSQSDWVKIRQLLENCTNYRPVVQQWGKLIIKLTKVLSLHACGIDIDQAPKDEIDGKSTQRLRAATIQTRAKPSQNLSPQSSQHIVSTLIQRHEKLLATNNSTSQNGHADQISSNYTPINDIPTSTTMSSSITMATDTHSSPNFISKSNSLEALPDATRVSTGEQYKVNNKPNSTGENSKGSNLSLKSGISSEGVNEKLSRSLCESQTIKLPSFSQSILAKLYEFVNIENLSWWSAYSALFMWKNALCCIGDINKILSPATYADAVQYISIVWDLLSKIREIQPYDNVLLPPLFEFFPWLVKACEMSDEFAEGRELAYSSICRMMIKRHDQSCERRLFPHFYRVILKGLGSDDTKVIYAILSNCSAIFTLNLPGSTLLISPLLRTIKKLLLQSPKDSNAVPENIRQASVQIIHSLISLPNLLIGNHTLSTSIELPPLPKSYLSSPPHSSREFQALTHEEPFVTESDETAKLGETSFREDLLSSQHPLMIPVIGSNLNLDKVNSMTPFELKLQLKDMLMNIIEDERNPTRLNKSYDTMAMILWSISVFCFEEMIAATSPSSEVIDECIGTLLIHLTLSNIKIVCAAADGLSLLAINGSTLKYIDRGGMCGVIGKIVGALTEHLMFQTGSSKEITSAITVRLLSCLLDWVMLSPVDVMGNPRMAQMIFEALEAALDINFDDSESVSNNNMTSSIKPISNLQRPNSGRSSTRQSMIEPINFLVRSFPSGKGKSDGMSQVVINDDVFEENIKEAAENFLLHILHHYNNFSSPCGPSVMSSQIVEPDDAKENEKSLYFTMNGTTLLTFCSNPEGAAKGRVIIRDMTGRYVWDYSHFFENFIGPLSTRPPPIEMKVNYTETTALSTDHAINDELICDSQQDSIESSADELDGLLRNIYHEHPDCINQSAQAFCTDESLVAGDVALFESYIKQQEVQEATYPEKFLIESSEQSGIVDQKVPAEKQFTKEKPPKMSPLDGSFSIVRVYLNQMGHFNFDSLKEEYFHILTKSPSLLRDIKGLDRKHGREVAKVAIIYVGPGQEDEYSLLRNDQGSAEYQNFVMSLGWEIDLATHQGYLGGLEKSQATGSAAIYFANSATEIVFHDITKFPVDPDDPKQLKRKRHIGNDHVHIIWNEHYRDFKKNTIGGDFGNALIVVTPLVNNLYAIDVIKDAKVLPFGPLQHRMVVSKASLGPLVRATALNAYRSALHSGHLNATPLHPFSQRLTDIRTIISRHKNNSMTFNQYIQSFF